MAARCLDRAVLRRVVEHQDLGFERDRRSLAREGVEPAQQELALLGVDDAVGDLDAWNPCAPVRVHVVDPPAYTPPYDHALCAALAAAGADVELWTSRVDYGATPSATTPLPDRAPPAGSPVRDAAPPAGSPLRDPAPPPGS